MFGANTYVFIPPPSNCERTYVQGRRQGAARISFSQTSTENQQNSAEHKLLNPAGLVPVLEMDGMNMTESLAVMEYLEEKRLKEA